jgi:hypothetical protein
MSELVDPDLLTDEFFEELEAVLIEDDEKLNKPKRSFELDDTFFAELDELVDADFRNCGTGAVGGKQGFQPGNKCAGTGEKSKGKAEGKKKDVHSDWDDGATAARHWDYDETMDEFRSSFSAYSKDEDGEEEYFYQLEADRDPGHPVGEMYVGEDSPFYDVQFSLENGKNRFRIQDTKTAQQVFRNVTNRMLSLYDLHEVDGLIFSSSRNEPSRTKLYHFLSKFAQKRRGIKALIDNNYRNKVVFHLVNEKIADDYKEIYRLGDKPIYWLDETNREDLDIAGVL